MVEKCKKNHSQAPDRNPGQTKITLTDGSLIYGDILMPDIPARTIFGTISLPLNILAGMTFQITSDDTPLSVTDSHDPRLVYWNTFNSEEETYVAKGMKRADSWAGGRFVEGKFGKAFYTGGKADVYQFTFPAHTLKPKGCIEFWARFDPPGDSFADGSWLRFFWMDHVRLEFAVNNGKGAGGITSYIANSVAGSSGSGQQHRYSEVLGLDYRGWHHYALVWSDEGVDVGGDGSKPWSVIFIDGKPVSHETIRHETSNEFTFGTIVGKELVLTIAGSAYVAESSLKRAVPFAIDELKIWNYDKTEF